MKTKEEIEKLAEKFWLILGEKHGIATFDEQLIKDWKFGFFRGYTQCQQDNADKKYTIKEVERYHDIRATQGIKSANNYIQSLNKQDKE
jgi:hypothetical protein